MERKASQMTLPKWPIDLIRPLAATAPIWLVGGTVRDLLLNRPLHDWDFVTSGNGISLARNAANLLKGAFYVLDRERKTGRAVVHPPQTTEPITLDFASLRAPELKEDLVMRDFTINAMAMTLQGELVDPLDSLRDLDKSLLRMTTATSFSEDPIRLLRAVRQAHALGLEIEQDTYAMLLRQAHLITTVAPERILAECCALFDLPIVTPGVQTLHHTGLLSIIIPELPAQQSLQSAHKEPGSIEQITAIMTVLDHIVSTIYGSQVKAHPGDSSPIPRWDQCVTLLARFQEPLMLTLDADVNAGISQENLLRWAVLFDSVPAEHVQRRLTVLRLPNKSIDFITTLLSTSSMLYNDKHRVTRRQVYRYFSQAGEAGPAAILYALASRLATMQSMGMLPELDINIDNAGVMLQAYFNRADWLHPVPFLNGHDILDMGEQPGAFIGEVLDELVEAQAAGEVTSRMSALRFVKHKIASKTDPDKEK